MPDMGVDKPTFDAVYKMLNLTLPVALLIDDEAPPALANSISGNQASAMLDQSLAELDDDVILENIWGAYGPQIDENGVLEQHAIWVRPSRGPVHASVSMIHEMVHASQIEGLGLDVYQEMDLKFMEELGYDGNPFEIEAESMSRFLVDEGYLIFREIN